MERSAFEGMQERADWARDKGRSVATVNRLVARGMPHVRFGRTILIDVAAAERWIREGNAAAPRFRAKNSGQKTDGAAA